LTTDFAEDTLLKKFSLDIFDKNSGSEPRAFFYRISFLNNDGWFVARTNP